MVMAAAAAKAVAAAVATAGNGCVKGNVGDVTMVAVAAAVAVAAVYIYYALPVVCTSRYILLAKRSILTKAQVEPSLLYVVRYLT